MATLDKEVRQVLLGRTKLLEDGRLSSLSEGDYMMPRGIVDGATAVRFLGVARRARVLKADMPEKRLKETVKKAMQDIGRGVVLQEAPEVQACLLRYLLSRPAILCFFYEDGLPIVAAYTGRGVTGFISLIRAFAKLRKQLPDTVQYSDQAAPDHRKEEREKKKQERAEKKRAKKEKKARRKDRKTDKIAEDLPEEGESSGQEE